jgi:adenylosuccinate lyase
MLKLVEKGWSREQAYDTVQPQAIKAWENNLDFRTLMEGLPEVTAVLTPEEIDDCFDTSYHTHRIDEIYHRVGLL